MASISKQEESDATAVTIAVDAARASTPSSSGGFHGFSMTCMQDKKADRVDFVPEAIVLENGFTYHLQKPEPQIANAGPIGLMAFGITTTLLNIVNAGLVDHQAIALVVAYGAMHGGFVQVLAGMWEIKRGKIFGGVAFSTYGAFWMSFALFEVLVSTGVFALTPDIKGGLCAYFCIWGVFTIIMLVGTFRLNIALQWVFFTLVWLFFLLAGGQYSTTCEKVAGWVGIICGLSAMYVGGAELINEMYERTVMPLFPVSDFRRKRQ